MFNDTQSQIIFKLRELQRRFLAILDQEMADEENSKRQLLYEGKAGHLNAQGILLIPYR